MTAGEDEITTRNRGLLTNMFDSHGSYGRVCVAHIVDGVRFRLIGDTLWSGTFLNKHDWAQHVFMALPLALVGPIPLAASRILVEGDYACVKARGTALVRNGGAMTAIAAGCFVCATAPSSRWLKRVLAQSLRAGRPAGNTPSARALR